jgi:hypothetical protein
MSVSTANASFFSSANAIFFCWIFSFRLLYGGVSFPLSLFCASFGSLPNRLLNSSFNCCLKLLSIDFPLAALRAIDLEVGKVSPTSSGIVSLI